MDDPYMAEQDMYFIYVCVCVCIYKCTWLHAYRYVCREAKYQHILLFFKKHPTSSLAEKVPSLWLTSAFTSDLCGLPKAGRAMKGKIIKASRQATSWFMRKRGRMPLSLLTGTSQLSWAASSGSCLTDVLQSKAMSFQFESGGCFVQPIACQMRLQTGTKYLKATGLCHVQYPALAGALQSDYWVPSCAISKAAFLHCFPSLIWISDGGNLLSPR